MAHHLQFLIVISTILLSTRQVIFASISRLVPSTQRYQWSTSPSQASSTRKMSAMNLQCREKCQFSRAYFEKVHQHGALNYAKTLEQCVSEHKLKEAPRSAWHHQEASSSISASTTRKRKKKPITQGGDSRMENYKFTLTQVRTLYRVSSLPSLIDLISKFGN